MYLTSLNTDLPNSLRVLAFMRRQVVSLQRNLTTDIQSGENNTMSAGFTVQGQVGLQVGLMKIHH